MPSWFSGMKKVFLYSQAPPGKYAVDGLPFGSRVPSIIASCGSRTGAHGAPPENVSRKELTLERTSQPRLNDLRSMISRPGIRDALGALFGKQLVTSLY